MSRSQAWKSLERETAKMLDGKRVSRGGDFSQSLPDVWHVKYGIECKYRKTLPKLITDGLKQAKLYNNSKIPLLVLKEKGKHDTIVCLSLKHFVELTSA